MSGLPMIASGGQGNDFPAPSTRNPPMSDNNRPSIIVEGCFVLNCDRAMAFPGTSDVKIINLVAKNSNEVVTIRDPGTLHYLISRIRGLEVDAETRDEMVKCVTKIEECPPGKTRLDIYERFVSIAANHMTVLSPLLAPLLALVKQPS
jgi:hypothetical protein